MLRATKGPQRSLSLIIAAIATINRTQGTRTVRNRWDVSSESEASLPLWEANDRIAHRRLTFTFATRVAYIETLRNLASLWTTPTDGTETFTLI
jgi:hypothetical protein